MTDKKPWECPRCKRMNAPWVNACYCPKDNLTPTLPPHPFSPDPFSPYPYYPNYPWHEPYPYYPSYGPTCYYPQTITVSNTSSEYTAMLSTASVASGISVCF